MHSLQMGSYLPHSRANGPGDRAVLWVQGCLRRCVGCCNPEFQAFDKGTSTPVEKILEQIELDRQEFNLRGLSLSGGEPLHPFHRDAIADLLENLHPSMDVFVFTGYEEKEIKCVMQPLFDRLDLIIAGPYDLSQRRSKGFLSSDNQTFLRLSNRFDDISDDEILNGDRILEYHIDGGRIVVSGLMDRSECLEELGAVPEEVPPPPLAASPQGVSQTRSR